MHVFCNDGEGHSFEVRYLLSGYFSWKDIVAGED